MAHRIEAARLETVMAGKLGLLRASRWWTCRAVRTVPVVIWRSCGECRPSAASCAERAVDAEAVYSLTTLTTLRFVGELGEDGTLVEAVCEMVLDLSRLTTLTCLHLVGCSTVTSEVMRAVRCLPARTTLNLDCDVTNEGLRAVIK
jgi:hypothetical protein